jgi:hypothetical protein
MPLLVLCLMVPGGCKKTSPPATMAPVSGAATSAPTTATTQAIPGGRLDVDFSALPVAAEAVESLTPSGGAVALANGTRVQIPAGALDRAQRVAVRSRTNEPDGPCASVTEIDAGGVVLKQDAVLTLPCPRLPVDLAKYVTGYRVTHYHDGRVSELASTWDRVSNTVVTHCREFSDITVAPADPDADMIDTRIRNWAQDVIVSGGGPVPPIPVPYYYQGLSQWCWAASAEMMLKAYGHDTEIWELARWNRSRFEAGKFLTIMGLGSGLGDFWQVWGSATDMFTKRGLPVEHFRVPWSDVIELYSYLVRNVRAGRPVMMTIGNFHVVVVVGCDEDGVYVNDPSGALIEVIALVKGKQVIADEGKLAGVHVRWEDLKLALNASITGGTRLGLTWTTCIPAPMSPGSPATVQLFYNDLAFAHPNPRTRPVPHPNAFFAWDGTVNNGYRFCFDCGDDALTGAAHTQTNSPSSHISPLYATMSDAMYLSVRLNNPTNAPISARLTGTLGGKPLLRQPYTCTIPPRTTHVEATFVKDVRVRSLGLAVGTYPLRVELVTDNTPADNIELNVPVGPSQVTGVELKNLDDGGGLLTWNAVPEKDVEYHVYFVYIEPKFNQYILVDRGYTRDAQYKFPAPRKRGDDGWWTVVARHIATKLEGPPSDYVEDAGEQDRPYLLRSENRDGVTYVDFRSQAWKKLPEGATNYFYLYRSDNAAGPWTTAGHLSVTRRNGKLIDSQNGRLTAEDRAEFPDTDSNSLPQRNPPFYKVSRINFANGKEVEIDSSILRPGGGRSITVRVKDPERPDFPLQREARYQRVPDDDTTYELPGDALATTVIDPKLPQLHIGAALAMDDQAYTYAGAHVTIQWMGKTWHVWSASSPSSLSLGRAEVDLPMQIGAGAIQFRAEGDDSSNASRSLTIVCSSPQAGKRTADAAVSVDDDPEVRQYLPDAQAAPAKIAALEQQLTSEIDPDRKRDIQQEILRLEEIQFNLEDARLRSVRKVARLAAMACQWDRAVALLGDRLKAQTAINERYMLWIQKAHDWKLLSVGAGQQMDELDDKYTKSAIRSQAYNRIMDHQLLLDLATRDGDYVTVRYCALTLVNELQKLPPGLKEGDENIYTADEIWQRFASATALLTGDPQLAAAYLANIKKQSFDPPAWMPRSSANPRMPAPSLSDQLRDAQRQWNQQVSDLAPTTQPH